MEKKIKLSILLLFAATSFASHAKENHKSIDAHGEAVESCVTLTNKSVKDLGVTAEYQGITQNEWRQIVASMCLGGIAAAREAASKDELDTYWLKVHQKYAEANAGALSTPIDPAWTISTKYFNKLHPEIEKQRQEEKRKTQEMKAKFDAEFDANIGFPKLPSNYTNEQFNTAYNYFINTKKVKGGQSIRETCQKAIKDNNFLGNFSFTQRMTAHNYDKQAVTVCQNVMVFTISNGKYGDNPQKIAISSSQGELSKIPYPGNKYMAMVADWASSNAK
ncbi:hypothetical protein TX36_23075 [Salmonella enterica]|nr:hypothetical protein [Salmonella enterica]EBO9972188.1 hypothetical protein [Salmonella enterica]EBP3368979.1 hypothetical protein [Salmonella enterica]